LYLEGNQIRSLPESIGKLKSLRVLKINSNQLTTLPESIMNLKRNTNVYIDLYLKDFITNPYMLKFVVFEEEQGDTKPAMQS